MLIEDLKAYGASDTLIKALSSTGLKELYPPQELALEAGLLKGEDSFVISAPTAGGKTLIAEMSSLKIFLETKQKTIYLVPLKALAREKYEDFLRKYKALGMRVALSTGDYDREEPWLQSADLIIATNEKIDSLIRHHAAWLKDVGLVVADEIHLMGDSHRGPTLEIVLSRLRAINPSLRLIALSATIPNADEISRWLNARLIESDWRPVPLKDGVYYNGNIIFGDGTVRHTPQESRIDVVDLCLETIRESGQAIVFVSTRKSTEAVSKKCTEYVVAELKEEEIEALKGISDEVLSAVSEPTHLCKKLAEHVANGVAFHHAGIAFTQRKIVEDAFRQNKIKLIASTTTLAMGLNLPSRRVIIRDWLRYESGMGQQPIPAIEIKQMSGRAGRPGYDKYGEAVIIARTIRDEQRLFEKYIKGSPEKILSQLITPSALRTHILASIAGGFTTSMPELKGFLSTTFAGFQRGVAFLMGIAEDIVDFLSSEGMVVQVREGLNATRFGKRVSELYIDPMSAVIIRDGIHMPKAKEVFPLLHLIASTPDMMRLTIRKKDHEEMLDVFYSHANELLISDEQRRYPTDETLSQLKTASLLMQWILEMPEDKITSHFTIGPGDLRSLVELSNWLIYSAGEIGRVFGLKEEIKGINKLRVRLSYGVKEELLPLVSLKGIGRVRARSLYDAGYKGTKDIKEASLDALVNVPNIGHAVAESIKGQV